MTNNTQNTRKEKINALCINRKTTENVDSIIIDHKINICIDKYSPCYFVDKDTQERVARYNVKCTDINGGTYKTSLQLNYTEKDVNRLVKKLVNRFYGKYTNMLDNIMNMLSSTLDYYSIDNKTLKVLTLSAIKNIKSLLKIDTKKYICDIIALYILHGDCIKVCKKLKGFNNLCLNIAHNIDEIIDLWEDFLLAYSRQNSFKLIGIHTLDDNGNLVEVDAVKASLNEAVEVEYKTAELDTRIEAICDYLYYNREAEKFAYIKLDSSKEGTNNRRIVQKKAEKLQAIFRLEDKIRVKDFKALCILALQQHSIA